MPADAVLLAGARLPGADGLVAVRLRGGVVDRVEPDVVARGASAAGERVERVELDGRWIVPGLWDEHVHFSQWAVSRRRVDVGRAASAAEAAATIRTAIDAGLVDDLVVARDFRDGLWPDRPSAAALDAVVPERAVVVVSSDLHALWLNSRALTAFGLPDHPTGVLREGEAFALHPRITAVPERRLDAWVADAARAAAARGVVGIHDLEMHGNLEGWSRRMAAGFDVLRVDSGVYPDALDRALDAGLRTGLELSPLHRVGHCKVITDGSLGTRTAFCADPYPDTEDRGVLAVPPEALRALLERAIAGGFVPAVHAIGDEANRHAIDVLVALGAGGRIEHAQLLHLDDVPRLAAAGITASIQPEHAMDDRDLAERYWPGREHRAYLVRSLVDAGVTVRFGSDAPVTPLDPWFAISAAVTRAREGRDPWFPAEAITGAEAIDASTRACLAPGQPADLAVLELDPTDPANADRLRSMPVAATFLAGRATHRAFG